jgi:trehalose 6-phosphate synthase
LSYIPSQGGHTQPPAFDDTKQDDSPDLQHEIRCAPYVFEALRHPYSNIEVIQMRTEGKTIVVSNCLPLTLELEDAAPHYLRPSIGGLARTLDSILWNSGGIWVACSPTEDVAALTEKGRDWNDRRGYSIAPVGLSTEERMAYEGFSNDAIWPLFHSLKSQCRMNPECWSSYRGVNGRIAEAVRTLARPEDFVWVHDYQLMMVASLLRNNGWRHRIGYSLHIPFPHPAILKTLQWRVELLHALLQYDLIGFQNDDDRGNFIASLAAFLPLAHPMEVEGKTVVRFLDRETRIGTYPVGIDYDEFSLEASSPNVIAASKAIREYMSGAQVILAVDRMDSTSGIYERVRAFRRLLEFYPEMKGRVTLTQIAIPSHEMPSEDKRTDLQIESTVGQINRKFGSHDWTPIHYYCRRLTQAQLISFYHSADVALITPLRGGMNLVAKEFCACRNDERGGLLLSEFSGAAEELKLGALLVDPYDVDLVASVLHHALCMSKSEQQERMAALRKHIRTHDVFNWAQSFQADMSPLNPTPPFRRVSYENAHEHVQG